MPNIRNKIDCRIKEPIQIKLMTIFNHYITYIKKYYHL